MIDGYMANGVFPPGSFDGMFKPLPEGVKADILVIQRLLKWGSAEGDEEAFNRLMAELHIQTERGNTTAETLEQYRNEMKEIDGVLDTMLVPAGSTVDRVRAVARHLMALADLITKGLRPLGGVKL